MIPVCLNLRNFMSYTDVHEPLRFEGIHVAVVSGENGHGKSSLLDAITWALWGQSRARSVDELIHAGRTEMEVEFEFLLDDEQYRVVRKRQKRGKAGLSDLQFAVVADGAYRPLTESSIQATEAAIRRTLKMSYETFTNSSFIQQGKADAFTTNQPAERKRILAEILELGYYDDLEQRAKEECKAREGGLREERARAAEWEAEIARRPEYLAEADRLKTELVSLEERARALESEANVLRERVVRLDAAEAGLREVADRLQRFEQDRQRTGGRLADLLQRLEAARSVLARAPEIEQASSELSRLRVELAAADSAFRRSVPLAQARERARAALNTERARLEAHLQHLVRQVPRLSQVVARRDPLRAELREAELAVRQVAEMEARQQELQAEAIRRREEAAEKRAENARLKQEMLDLRGRIDALEGLEICPSCQQPMAPTHKATLRTLYERQGFELKQRFRINEAQYAILEKTVAQQDAQLRDLANRLASREAAQRKLAETERDLAHAAQADEQLSGLQKELEELEGLLQANSYAPEQRQALARAEADLAQLGYDEAAHARARNRAGELAGADQERERLEQARLSAEHLGSEEHALTSSLKRLDEECVAEAERQKALRHEVTTFAQARVRFQDLDLALRAAASQRDRARELHAQAVGKVDYTHFVEKRLTDSVARQDTMMREQRIYLDLANAFGKRGIQAMIIETAIPELEDESNRLLERMTDGRMRVRFETQRDRATGSGVIETLDIKISDELGTRNYEMFSGGEGFRVNFAIRVALSRLLARRAGTKLQTLVIDEGFGSQDAEGRDRIVEAIQAIQPEFEKILIITHLDDLRDRFPVKIEVRKTARGSTVSLA